MAISILNSRPFSIPYDILTIHYLKWILTTPVLLGLLASLEKFRPSRIAKLMFLDVIAMVCGYLSYVAATPAIRWLFMGLGMIAWVATLAILIVRTIRFYGGHLVLFHTTRPMFLLLTAGVAVSWSLYPVVITLHETDVIPLPGVYIAFAILDFVNKGIFGCLLIGTKEIDEGIDSKLAGYAQAAERIVPIRRSSVPLLTTDPPAGATGITIYV
jgi:bacteriorhodopsin